MKFQEILYNSSESSITGSVGFGVRAKTDGASEEVLKALNKSSFFLRKYSAGTFKVPAPKALLENPSAILDYPVNYAYRETKTEDGRTIYVFLRQIPIVFDYAFFIDGEATRPGNYGYDAIIFDQKPEPEAFEIFYDAPAPGARAFFPANRVLSKDNPELKSIMECKPLPLPEGELDVRTAANGPINQTALNIFFHYVEAMQEGKSLIVRIEDKDKNIIIADLFRILGKYSADVTFDACSYEQGFSADTKITFISQYYPYQLMIPGDKFVQKNAADVPDTPLYKDYAEKMKVQIQKCDYTELHKLSSWILSGEWKHTAGKSEDIVTGYFTYCSNPDQFTLPMTGNRELLRLIAAKKGATSARILELGNEVLTNASDETGTFVKALKTIADLKEDGFDVSSLKDKFSTRYTALASATPEAMAGAFSALGKSFFEYFLDIAQFGGKYDYLSSPALRPILKDVFCYIIPQREKRIPVLLERLVPAVGEDETVKMLKLAENDARAREQAYVNIIKTSPEKVSVISSVMFKDIVSPATNFIKEFKSQAQNPDFAALFYYSASHIPITDASAFIESNAQLMSDNAAYKKMVSDGEGKNHIYHKLIAEITRKITDKNAAQMADLVNHNILYHLFKANPKELNEWCLLSELLTGQYDDNISLKYELARDSQANKIFSEIAYKCLSSASGQNEISKLINDMLGKGCLDKKKFVEIAKSLKKKDIVCAAGTYMECSGMKFQDAKAFVDEAFTDYADQILETYYTNDFKSWKRKQALKSFFSNLFKKKKKPSDNMKLKTLLIPLLFICSMFQLSARDFGENITKYEYRYVVNCRALNLREKPKTGKVVMGARQGDILYGTIETVPGETWNWLKVDGVEMYASTQYLVSEANPHYMKPVSSYELGTYDFERTLRIQRIVRWILLGLCILAFVIFMILFTWGSIMDLLKSIRKPSYYDEKSRKDHMIYDMRLWFYKRQPYQAVLALTETIVLSILAGIIVLMTVAGIGWGLMALVWVLMWALVVIGWILVIGGVITIVVAIFSGGEEKGCLVGFGGIAAIFLGYCILKREEDILDFGERALDAGRAFFQHLYILDFVRDLFLVYWKTGLIIIFTPIAIFLALVIINFIVSGILIIIEKMAMRHYNIKNPCPVCQHNSEPAIYFSRMTDGTIADLPVKLQPGRYGLLHIKHPDTGEIMPTMFFNGKDKCFRKCGHCGAAIKADMGIEKHIALVGVAESGKTTLAYRMITQLISNGYARLMDKDNMDAGVKNDIETALKNIKNGEGVLDQPYPNKTEVGLMRSIQLKLRRKDSSIDYRLFINDVGGELYDTTSVDSSTSTQISLFARNVNTILFLVDPITTDFSYNDVSDEFKEWLKKNQKPNTVKINIKRTADRLIDLLTAHNLSDKDLGKINFEFILVKADLGYLDKVDNTNEEALKGFMYSDMGLEPLIQTVETKFKKIGYSVYSANKKYSGYPYITTNLIERITTELGIAPLEKL